MFNLFEQPWSLSGVAVIVLFGLFTFRSVWSEKRRPWQLLIPILIAAFGFGLDFLVKTDPEKVRTTLKKSITAVREEDPDVIATLIANNYYDSYHGDKQSLIDHARSRLGHSPVEKIKKAGLMLNVSPPEALAVLAVWIRFAEDSYVAQNYKPLVLVKAEINFTKQPDKSWLISRVELLEIDKQPVAWRQTR